MPHQWRVTRPPPPTSCPLSAHPASHHASLPGGTAQHQARATLPASAAAACRCAQPRRPRGSPTRAGVHITLPDYYSPENVGMIVPKTKDGRVVFMLPWEGATIAGTTDAPSAVTMTPQATEADVAFILSAIEDFLDVQVHPPPIATHSAALAGRLRLETIDRCMQQFGAIRVLLWRRLDLVRGCLGDCFWRIRTYSRCMHAPQPCALPRTCAARDVCLTAPGVGAAAAQSMMECCHHRRGSVGLGPAAPRVRTGSSRA